MVFLWLQTVSIWKDSCRNLAFFSYDFIFAIKRWLSSSQSLWFICR